MNQPLPLKTIIFLCTIGLLCACSSSTKQSSLDPSSPKANPNSTTEQATTSPPNAPSSLVIKARNTEAKATLGSVKRAQQIYHLENGQFTKDPNALDLSLKLEYFTVAEIEADETTTTFKAVAKEVSLNSYAGGVSQEGDIFESILCESRQPGLDIAPPNFEEGTWSCGPDSKNVDG